MATAFPVVAVIVRVSVSVSVSPSLGDGNSCRCSQSSACAGSALTTRRLATSIDAEQHATSKQNEKEERTHKGGQRETERMGKGAGVSQISQGKRQAFRRRFRRSLN